MFYLFIPLLPLLNCIIYVKYIIKKYLPPLLLSFIVESFWIFDEVVAASAKEFKLDMIASRFWITFLGEILNKDSIWANLSSKVSVLDCTNNDLTLLLEYTHILWFLAQVEHVGKFLSHFLLNL